MLTEEQSNQLRETLDSEERRLLLSGQATLQLSMERATDSGRDSIDQSSSEELLSSALRLRDRDQKLLEKIRHAVARLERGELDQCEECEEPIGFKRLLARPVTTFCIECKESAEEEERRQIEQKPSGGWDAGSLGE